MNLLVSACLLGIGCKYSGGDNLCPPWYPPCKTAGTPPCPSARKYTAGCPRPARRPSAGAAAW